MADLRGTLRRPASLIAPAAALLAAGVASFALVRGFISLEPADLGGPVVMVPATALGILLASCALLLLRPHGRPLVRLAARVLAAGSALLGVAVLVQSTLEWQLGLAEGPLLGLRYWWATLQPSAIAALGLLLVGLAELCSSFPQLRAWAGAIAGAALVLAFAVLAGQSYGASVLLDLRPAGGAALSTLLTVAAVAIGVIFVDPSRGVASALLSRDADGRLLRRLLPAAVLAPVLLGWLALRAENAGLVDVEFGTALLAVALSVLLAGYIVRQGKALHSFHLEREHLFAAERDARAQVTSILESITDAFFAVDRRWRLTYVNREAERLLDRPREQLVGRELWAEFPAADSARFRREYELAMAEQRTVHFEEYYAPKDLWFGVRAYPSADGLSVYFNDITDRRKAEQQLQESEERHRLLTEMIPQHVWTTGPDGYHDYFSRSWYEYTGTAPEETCGNRWLDLLHPDDRERTLERWQHSLSTGEPYAIEYRFRGADGAYTWFLGQARPRRDESGRIVQWFGTLTNISERKQLEEERERLNESRNRLLHGFSHDVRNPLSAADSQAWLLIDGRVHGDLTPGQKNSVQLIRRSIRSSLRLIDDLLELARAGAGQLALECRITELGGAVHEVVDEFRAQALGAGLTLEAQVPQDLRAWTDATRVRQILSNLLSNAVKYAANGRLFVRARQVDGGGPRPGAWTLLEVIDCGPGIPRDKQELIFQEYTRLEHGARRGAGIGLAISRRIARMMGGDLTVDSEPGRGSTFTLWMPSAPQVAGALPAAAAQEK